MKYLIFAIVSIIGFACDSQRAHSGDNTLIIKRIDRYRGNSMPIGQLDTILIFESNNDGLIDSVIWYMNPMGPIKYSFTEYHELFENISYPNCELDKMFVDLRNNILYDRCDTLEFGTMDIKSNSIIIKRDNMISEYFISEK
jgi:hypothetical protein